MAGLFNSLGTKLATMKTIAYFEVHRPSSPQQEKLCLDDDRGTYSLNARPKGRFGYSAGAALPADRSVQDLEEAVHSFLAEYEDNLVSIERSGSSQVSEIQVKDRRVRQVAEDQLQSLARRREDSGKLGWGGLVGRAFDSLQPDDDIQQSLAEVFTQDTLAAITGYRDHLREVNQAVTAAQPPEGLAFRRAHRQLLSLVGVSVTAAESLHRHLELSLMVPDRAPKNREVNRLAREMTKVERDLEHWQEQQQWELVKFAEGMTQVLGAAPEMSRALRLPLPVEQALLGLGTEE